MAKYDVYDHRSGRVQRGDRVAAYVPAFKGRVVVQADVVKINRKSITVEYYWNRRFYRATLPDHYWTLIYQDNEMILSVVDYSRLRSHSDKFINLIAAGVEEWEGYERAMEYNID